MINLSPKFIISWKKRDFFLLMASLTKVALNIFLILIISSTYKGQYLSYHSLHASISKLCSFKQGTCSLMISLSWWKRILPSLSPFLQTQHECFQSSPRPHFSPEESSDFDNFKFCKVWTLKLMTSRLDFLCLTFHHSTATTKPNSSNCLLCQNLLIIFHDFRKSWKKHKKLYLTTIFRSYIGGSLLQTKST